MGRSFLVLGTAAVWLGSGYDDWKSRLAETLPPLAEESYPSITLDFRVTEFDAGDTSSTSTTFVLDGGRWPRTHSRAQDPVRLKPSVGSTPTSGTKFATGKASTQTVWLQ